MAIRLNSSSLFVLVSLSFSRLDLSAESLRSLDRDIHAIEDQLATLPVREPGETGGSAGIYVSHLKKDMIDSDSITVDLDEVYSIDHIVLVPTRLQNVQRKMESVGFPVRFEIVGSETADFSNPISFYAGAERDYPDPKGYPALFNGNGMRARYLRIVVYDMHVMRGIRAFSFAELFVFSDGRNVAIRKKVYAPNSVSWDSLFDDAFLVDGQTSLGQPGVLSNSKPAGRGWHAKVQNKSTSDEFVELRFEHPHELEEVRLYPVYHNFWPKSTDYGFPVNFRLQVKEEGNGTDWTTVEDWSKSPFPRPGNSPVYIPLKGRNVKAVRLQALTLPQSIPLRYIFALAEMEVYADGVNIAPQAKIVSSSLHNSRPKIWNEQALTDGFATRGKIVPLLSWLEGLAKRGELEDELAKASERRIERQERLTRNLRLSVGVLSISLFVAAGFLIYNFWKRQRQLNELQNQIASDLHDEVGSNLASITILAAGTMDQCEPESVQAESLKKMVDIAKDTSSSMHDIVWMLHPARKSNMSLTAKLQDIASSLLADVDFSFAESEKVLADRLSMDRLHHFLLFYKEVLHNLARHSHATRVQIVLSAPQNRIRLEITDNGAPPPSGLLPEGLSLRANQMKGTLSYKAYAEYNQLVLKLS